MPTTPKSVRGRTDSIEEANISLFLVARNLPAAGMTLDRKVAIIFFEVHNPEEALVVAVCT